MLRNVVIVSDAADAKGGASVAAIQSAVVLANSGLDVRLFAGTGPFSWPTAVPDRLKVQTLQDGLNLIKAPVLERATRSLWNKPAAEAFGELLSDLDPKDTVVHVHSFQVQLTSSVVRMAMDRGFPLVVTSHDYGLACPYSGLYDYNRHAPCGKIPLTMGCATTLCSESRNIPGKLWHLAKGRVQRDTGRVPSGADHLVFVSEFSRRLLGRYLPQDVPTSVVRNALDLPKEAPRDLRPDAPFLFVGRLTREKGPHLFAEAAKKLGVPAVIAGTGPEEDAVRQINPDIEFVGWKAPAEVRELMRQARALVFPSRCYEGEPLTTQEAMSVGLPVITSDVCAASAQVEDGVSGRVFQYDSADDLAEKLAELSDDARARLMGLAAYERYWANPPTADAHLESTLDVYREVLRRRA